MPRVAAAELCGRGRLVVAAFMVVALWSSASADPLPPTALLKHLDLVEYRPGTRAPDFTGPVLDAGPLSLGDLRGKVVIVNFWASWCLECRPEMPVLESLHRELASRGLAVVGINAREHPRAVGRYAQELRLTFPLVLDPAGKINNLYGVIGLPTTFVVGRDGRAVAFGVGARDWGSRAARALLETLLAESVP
jgi:cytochrome c biogenesis protein CcmG/thiol:disulfide interchange protein DsbE